MSRPTLLARALIASQVAARFVGSVLRGFGYLRRVSWDGDSRFFEAVMAGVLIVRGVQFALAAESWPYAVWFAVVPLWIWVLAFSATAGAVLVGVAIAQQSAELRRPTCPAWPLRAAAMALAAVCYFGLQLAIYYTARSVWGGIPELALSAACVFVATRHLSCRGEGPYS